MSNELIKLRIEKEFNEIYNELENTKFVENIKKEFLTLSKQEFSNRTKYFGEKILTKEEEGVLYSILCDKSTLTDIDQLHKEISNLDKKDIKEKLTISIKTNLKAIEPEDSNLKLNILLFEFDTDPSFCMCGFEDNKFNGQILDGEEYLEFNDEKELFNGVGDIDLTALLEPTIIFENKIGIKKFSIIENTFLFEYYNLINELYWANIHKILNEIFEENGKNIFKDSIQTKNKVYIYANEHDMPERNIYTLEF